MGTVAIVLVLLLKYAALQVMAMSQLWQAVLLAPVIGRTAMPVLLASTPYVRANGLGKTAATELSRLAAGLMAIVVVAIMIFCFRVLALTMVLTATTSLALLRWLSLRRLGGVTGDICGAVLELVEALSLTAAAIVGSGHLPS
jgi:adenosylcobinamide-GDP ribazoletransferase